MRRLLQHRTESSIIPNSKERSVWRNKRPRSRIVSFRVRQYRLPDLRVLPGHCSQRFRWELCRPIYNCSSKWWYVGIRFEMGRNSIVHDENPAWWHLGRIVQIGNARVWKLKTSIGIVRLGDSSEESWTWLSQIEDNGEKKYRVRIYEFKTFEARNGTYERNAVVKNQGTKTACTKNSWRLLAMGVQRAVF